MFSSDVAAHVECLTASSSVEDHFVMMMMMMMFVFVFVCVFAGQRNREKTGESNCCVIL